MLTKKYIIVITSIQIVFVIFFIFKLSNYDDLVFSPIRNDDSDRNERSTPREFLLPATPAVAEIQEQRRKEKNKSEIVVCLSILDKKGYDVYNLEDDVAANRRLLFINIKSLTKLKQMECLMKKQKKSLECLKN